MRVLLTNRELANRAGSELWVRDVALALLARSHAPVAYSPRLGEVAAELRRATVAVVDDLEHLAEAPDVIHGQHHLETMTALLRFPGAPALCFCHGWAPAVEAPPDFPRIRRYVAVDDLVRERLIAECGIAPARVAVVRNFVDLARFPRRSPLPASPRRALVLSNLASETTYLPPLRAACARRGIELVVAGAAAGNPVERPHELLAAADVVFAKSRAALEAAAVGCFVVLCDAAGLGPVVLPADLERLRAFNFGARLLREPVTSEAVEARLESYDGTAAATVADRLRGEVGLDRAVEQLLRLYAEVIAEQAAAPTDPAVELRAASRYLRWGPLRGALWWDEEALTAARSAAAAAAAELSWTREALEREREGARETVAALEGERQRTYTKVSAAVADATAAVEAAADTELRSVRGELESARQRLRDQAAAAESEWRRAQEALAAAAADAAALRRELGWVTTTAAWRWRERFVRMWPLAAVYRWLRGRR